LLGVRKPPHRRFTTDSIVELAIPITLGIAPLIFLRTGGEFENNPKSAFLQWAIALSALLWLVWGDRGQPRNWRRTPLDLPIAFFCLACLLSLVRAVNVLEAVPLLLHWGAGVILYLLLTRTLRGPQAVPRFFFAATVSCLIVCLVGVAQVLVELQWIPQSVPPASTLSNRNMASHYVAICFPLALGLIAVSRNAWGRALGAMCVVASMLFLFYTKTRSAWLAVLVVILATALGLPMIIGSTGWTHVRRLVLYAAVALLLGACLVGILVIEDVLESDEATVERLASMAGANRGTMKLRTIFWKNSLAMARDHPVAGVGLGNFKLVYPRYHRAAEIDWTFGEEYQLKRVHNDHLQILAELGLVGLVAWIAIYACAFRLAWSCLRRATGWIPLQMFFVSLGIAAFLVVACFSFPMERAMPPVYVFALLGMTGFLHASATGPSDRQSRLPEWARWACVVMLVGFLSGSVVVARKAVLTDMHYTTAVRLTHAGEHARAVAVLEQARRLSPKNVNVLLVLARNHAAMGRCDLALENLEDVLRVDPFKINAISNLGYCNLQLRRYNEAERYFRRALEILPDSPQIHTNLGTAYFRLNRHELAIETYRRAIELATTTWYLPSVRAEFRQLQPRLLLANVYVASNRLDEAIEEYEEVLRLEPGRQDVRRLLEELNRTVSEPDVE
jgi:O-antigen ligase/Flp pilus assembly protein TadD